MYLTKCFRFVPIRAHSAHLVTVRTNTGFVTRGPRICNENSLFHAYYETNREIGQIHAKKQVSFVNSFIKRLYFHPIDIQALLGQIFLYFTSKNSFFVLLVPI